MHIYRYMPVILASFAALKPGLCRPDFGLPAVVQDSRLVGWNAYVFGESLNEMLNPLRRIPPSLQSENLRQAAGNMSMLVVKITDIGRNLANNLSKAVSERDVPYESIFRTLYLPFEEMKQFLTKDGQIIVRQLNETMGNTTAFEFDNVLNELNNSCQATLKTVKELESAISVSVENVTSIPAVLNVPNRRVQVLSQSLELFTDQVKLSARVVDASTRSIESANADLNSVNANILAIESIFKSALLQFDSTIDEQLLSAIIKYTTAQQKYQADFAIATQLLKIFSTNQTLSALTYTYTEEFTKNYYALYSRNQSDIALICNAFDWIRSNIAKDVNEASRRFFHAVNDTSASLVRVILNREQFAARCNGQFFPRITGKFPGFQAETINCLNRERGRVSRIVDVIERVLLLVQSNSVDFSSDIGRCSRFNGFAVSEADYLQAKACLEAGLLEMDTYNRLMNAQLDSLKPIMAGEAEASRFRTRQCILQTANEMNALLNGVKSGLLNCAVNGS